MSESESGTSPLVLSYSGPTPDDELLGWITDGIVSGVILFRDNAPDEDSVRAATERIHAAGSGRVLIMIDEEGGRVRRLPDAAESMPELRRYADKPLSALADSYRAVAERLKRLGIDVLLAPVIDVGGFGTEWLDPRTFSDDPERIAEMARVVIPAIQATGVIACAKHFPGLHGVAVDPHTARATERTAPSEWENLDAIPFRAAVASGVQSIMVGHQIMMGFDPENPSCLSPIIVSVLLRQRLGYTGLVMTDDLAMGAIANYYAIEHVIPMALRAGCNRTLICNDRDLQRRAVEFWRTHATS
ncbi:MAG: beta-N-acetylhexosaminidase [Candidatus Zixiibacteriota bacterium]